MTNIEHDTFWDCIVGVTDFKSFKLKVVPELRLKPVVAEEVFMSFKIVRKLLEHCYFEYNFLDPAMAKALYSFEMALRARYKELHGSDWNENFQNLLYYYHDNGYFEVDRKEFLDMLRHFRNRFAHPNNSFEGGLGLMKLFSHCVNLINDSYEDPAIRKLRNVKKQTINEYFNNLKECGGLVVHNGKSNIIYQAGIYFIDNVNARIRYYGYVKMIFPLKHELDKGVAKSGSLHFFEAISYVAFATDKRINFTLEDGTIIYLSCIDKKINQDKFDSWIDAFKACTDDWTDIELNEEIDRAWHEARKKLHFGDK